MDCKLHSTCDCLAPKNVKVFEILRNFLEHHLIEHATSTFV